MLTSNLNDDYYAKWTNTDIIIINFAGDVTRRHATSNHVCNHLIEVARVTTWSCHSVVTEPTITIDMLLAGILHLLLNLLIKELVHYIKTLFLYLKSIKSNEYYKCW